MTTDQSANDTLSVSTHYAADHDRLDAHFNLYRSLKRVNVPEAKVNFREFKFGLQRHIIWEEEILFPLFEQKTGITTGGPTEVMRREHQLILHHLEAIHARVRVQDPETDEDEELLLNILTAHNLKEEKILYPAIDRAIGGSERAAVFTAMEQVGPERFAVCCHGRVHHDHERP